MVTVLDQNENKINSLKINLGKLEDNYHRENMEIEDKLYSLEDKKNELETYLQEVYEETSHLLRQNDSDGSTFMSLIGAVLKGTKEDKEFKKQIQRALVRIVYAPEIVEEADSIKMTYSDKIDNVSETAKSSIKTIANQIDSGLVGQFGEKVKAQVDLNKGSYDDL